MKSRIVAYAYLMTCSLFAANFVDPILDPVLLNKPPIDGIPAADIARNPIITPASIDDFAWGSERGPAIERQFQGIQEQGRVAQDRFDQVEMKRLNDEYRTARRAIDDYETYLAAAQFHADRFDFQAAIKAFNSASRTRPSFVTSDVRAEKLKALLEKQKNPIDVTITSDGKTTISVLGAELGMFMTRTVKVLPGDYRVVGKQDGFNDVVVSLRVLAGEKPPVVNVIPTGLSK